ncbi:YcxB family protein [Streptomyces sp. NPDC021098]|uniref:YcxB family protein n=1 Tax=unclassified Streptomyces TaxID=2593676 RepID=UPI00379B6A54
MGEQRAVELVYRTTVDDMTEALRARARHSTDGRSTRVLLVCGAVILALGLATAVAAGGGGRMPWMLVVAGVVLIYGSYRAPVITAKRFGKLLDAQGEFRAVVGETGIEIATAHSTTALGWQMYPRYLETQGLFVLLSADRGATGLAVLPKRGVIGGPYEVDRLRSVFDQRLTRLA